MAQRRPLAQASLPLAVTAGGVVVHTLNATAATKGGPWLQEVTLWIANSHNAAQVVRVAVSGAGSFDTSVPANTELMVFDGIPMVSSGATITCTNVTAAGSMAAFGWFTA